MNEVRIQPLLRRLFKPDRRDRADGASRGLMLTKSKPWIIWLTFVPICLKATAPVGWLWSLRRGSGPSRHGSGSSCRLAPRVSGSAALISRTPYDWSKYLL